MPRVPPSESCGSNTQGQLGIGSITKDVVWPASMAFADPVTTVSCGKYHGLAVTQDGSIWTWGNNQYGQLGKGTVGASGSGEPTPERLSVTG